MAVYGASPQHPGALGNVLLRNTAGVERVVAVHPGAREIEGRAAVPRLDGPVDLALVSLPAPDVPAAVSAAATAGTRVAVVLSPGFGEAGEGGGAAEARLRQVARAAGMRLVGPNGVGVVSARADGTLFNGSSLRSVPERTGPVSVVSQSGAVGGMLVADLRRRGLGLARFVGVGNAADVTEADVLEWLADDEETGAVGVFAEGLRDGRRFVAAARRVTRTTPVVVLKAGKGTAGARAAASHTGALAGLHGAAQAAFHRAGVWEAPDADRFFDALAALAARSDRPRAVTRPGCGLAVLTVSGGPGVLAADAAEHLGIPLPPPGAATAERLGALAPGVAALGNPIDLTPRCPPANLASAVDAVLRDPAYAGAVLIDCGLDVEEFARAAATAARRTGKPIAAFVLDVPGVEAVLAEAGVPLLASPERAVAAWAALARAR